MLYEVITRKVQAVGAAAVDGDANALAIDLLDRPDLRARRHEIGRLDLEVGGAERDLLGARRLGADQADVPFGDSYNFV